MPSSIISWVNFSAISARGCLDWVVTLDASEKPEFYGRMLEETLAWCLVWLMAPELGVGPFVI
jgi:hypothetical protein